MISTPEIDDVTTDKLANWNKWDESTDTTVNNVDFYVRRVPTMTRTRTLWKSLRSRGDCST